MMMVMVIAGVLPLVAASSARNHQTLVLDSPDGMRLQDNIYSDEDDRKFVSAFTRISLVSFCPDNAKFITKIL